MLSALILLGCNGDSVPADSEGTPSVAETEPAPLPPPQAPPSAPRPAPKPAIPAPSESTFVSEELLHVKLKEANPGYNLKGQFQIENNILRAAVLAGTGIQDLSPLRGLPIERLDLQGNPVTDLFHLKGMPLTHLYLDRTKVYDIRPLAGAKLEVLYLDGTGVEDISTLKGMPLTELNLSGTKVNDISALAGAPITMLWLSQCPLTDISPLESVPLISVTLHSTPLRDLAPLSDHETLQRLHIGETLVTDLTPLQGLQLSRLIFPVQNITKGLDVAKGMFSLQELGTSFENRADPGTFWGGVSAPAAASAP